MGLDWAGSGAISLQNNSKHLNLSIHVMRDRGR